MAHAQARVGHRWRDRPEGADYVTRLEWGQAAHIVRVEVVALPLGGRMDPSAQIHVRGLTLIDARDGSSVPVVLSTSGRYRRVHSGDVKVYEVMDALPRAFVVHRAQVVADDNAAIAMMRDPSFDPAEKVILAEGREIDAKPQTEPAVTVSRCDPEAVVVRATLHAPGYLVLSDTWYPGWTATVDGQGAKVERANVNSRAVYLEAGTHEVRFVYAPSSYRIGVAVSAAAVIARRRPQGGRPRGDRCDGPPVALAACGEDSGELPTVVAGHAPPEAHVRMQTSIASHCPRNGTLLAISEMACHRHVSPLRGASLAPMAKARGRVR